MHIKENNIAKLNTIKFADDTKKFNIVIDTKSIATIKESRANLIPAVVAQ